MRRSNWQDLIAEPVATRSSKPESVANEIAEKRKVQEERAHTFPITATVTSCVCLDANGNEIISVTNGMATPNGETSYKVLQRLAAYFYANIAGAFPANSVWLYGLDIREKLKIMALDALQYAAANPAEATHPIPDWLWTHRPFSPAPWCDPYDVLVSAEQRYNFPWQKVAQFFQLDTAGIETLDNSARNQAEIARKFAIAAGLTTRLT